MSDTSNLSSMLIRAQAGAIERESRRKAGCAVTGQQQIARENERNRPHVASCTFVAMDPTLKSSPGRFADRFTIALKSVGNRNCPSAPHRAPYSAPFRTGRVNYPRNRPFRALSTPVALPRQDAAMRIQRRPRSRRELATGCAAHPVARSAATPLPTPLPVPSYPVPSAKPEFLPRINARVPNPLLPRRKNKMPTKIRSEICCGFVLVRGDRHGCDPARRNLQLDAPPIQTFRPVPV